VTARIAWREGGEADVLSISADMVELYSTVPAPPGSRLEGTVLPADDPRPILVRVKIHGCRKQDDGAFLLRGRPLDLTREGRERLAAMLRPRD
jgi:hypothetical protein